MTAAVSPRALHLKQWIARALMALGMFAGGAGLWRTCHVGDWLGAHSSLLCGLLALACAIVVMMQEILLGPNSPNYPPGPWWVRLFLFFWMVGMAMRGVDILSSVGTPHPQVLAFSAVVGWATQVAAQMAILLLIAKERRPSWFWSRAKRAEMLAAKREQAAAAAGVIVLEGGAVAAAMETPEGSDFIPEQTRRVLQAMP